MSKYKHRSSGGATHKGSKTAVQKRVGKWDMGKTNKSKSTNPGAFGKCRK